jgi:diacylglycerol O-acyltransferase / wax synthase
MSAVDRSWLLMERRTNPMMVVALVILSKPLSLSALKRIVTERFLSFPRFRSRPVGEYLSASWVEDADFDLEAHVHRVALPGARGQAELEELVGELASTPLAANRPMWSFHLVERYRGGSAFVIRIHHCYADGIALVQVMLSLTDQAANVGTSNGSVVATERAGHASPGLLETVDAVYQPVTGLLERGVHYMLHPTEAASAATDALELAREFAHIAMLPDDPATRLKGPLGASKRVAWAEPLPLVEVRTIAKTLNCTINDVVMSTLAGCIGRYLESTGERVTGLTIRAAVPVNLRAAHASLAGLGNQFGLVFVDLPIGKRHPLERLYAMHDVMLGLRSSQQPLVAYGLLGALGALPAPIEEPAIELFSAKASAVVSNVPGPKEPLSMSGAPISQMLFWVPQSGSIGLGVSILSYADQVQFGVVADRNLIDDPHALTQGFRPEFERLLLLTLLGAPPRTK